MLFITGKRSRCSRKSKIVLELILILALGCFLGLGAKIDIERAFSTKGNLRRKISQLVFEILK